jgi:S-adenosylmethionine synthetase
MRSLFTSESVTEGHPDKICDLIADAILDAHLEGDPNSRVACEVLCKGSQVVIAGEINSRAIVDIPAAARAAIDSAGYNRADEVFSSQSVVITNLLSGQSERISGGIGVLDNRLGAGDQGLVFGYATDETPELLPVPVILAHKITKALARHRKEGKADFLRPDGKSQVTVWQEGGKTVEVDRVVVSTQHARGSDLEEVRRYIFQQIIPEALGGWNNTKLQLLLNPAGPFDIGGPEADCGVTGRKIIVDTYGGAGRHGGGAFSGKDATKVDRSGAYFARFVARQIVLRGIAREVEIQVSYAIGVPDPVSLRVDTRGTGDDALALEFTRRFDFRPAAIIDRLRLHSPIYTSTTNYGHFGKPELEWEK